MKPSVTDKTVAVTNARITALTGSLLPPRRTPHETDAIADALDALIADGAELLLVVGASAVVDRRDVGPAGIERAGGTIEHFGMPVDPGNLICLGRIGPRPALVLPGCARSPTLNGIDFVLARLFAGLPVGGREVSRMGVGGLLKDVDTRPLPRAEAPSVPRTGPAPRRAPTIAAVVLAAGRSRRMAPHNKLLIPDRAGKPMIARVVDAVLSSGARPVVVVTGNAADDIRAALGARPVTFVHAAAFASGLSASLHTGIAALPESVPAALVCLGDMPLVTGRILDRLIAAYDPDEGRLIVVPTCRGEIGNPVLWDRRFFADILALEGDAGARSLLRRHAEQVFEVEVGDDAVLRDFDTRESLETLPARLRPEQVG
jgi:molybdenum cofactor cytidylyltransferase